MFNWILISEKCVFIKVNQDGSALEYTPSWDNELLEGKISITERLKELQNK